MYREGKEEGRSRGDSRIAPTREGKPYMALDISPTLYTNDTNGHDIN
ncbi:hypothetical protein [Okeania sp. KiyG1]|nr:hypothetical protein [Okeania sp. KiyG1]